MKWTEIAAVAGSLIALLTLQALVVSPILRAQSDKFEKGVASVRADVASVRADVASVRADVASVRDDLHALSERVARIEGALTYRLSTPAAPAPAAQP